MSILGRGALVLGLAAVLVETGGDASAYMSTAGAGSGRVAVKAVTLTLTAPSSGTSGTAIATSSVKAKLMGAAPQTASVTFYYKLTTSGSAPATCAGFTVLGTTVTVTGDGTYHPTASLTPAAGTYWWYSTYSGSALNPAVHSTCGTGMAKTVVA